MNAGRNSHARAASRPARARVRHLLLLIAVVAGVLAMHAGVFTSGPSSAVPTTRIAAQAAPDDSGHGPAGCPCAGDCTDMSACQALADKSWAPDDLLPAAIDLGTGDTFATDCGPSAGNAPGRSGIGLIVTAVTVTRI